MGKDGGDINIGSVNGNVDIKQAGRDININGISYEIHNALLEKYVISKDVLKRIAKQCQSAKTLEQLVYWIKQEIDEFLTNYDSIQEFIEKLPPEAKANPDIQQLTDKLVEAVDEGHYNKLPDLFAKAIEMMKSALMESSPEFYWSSLYHLYTTRARTLFARGQYHQAAVDFHTASELIPQPDKGEENNLANVKTYTFRKLYSDCLHEAGAALRQAGKYEQAQQCLETALQWRKKLHANTLDNTDIASTINSLAVLYDEQGKYAEALRLHEQALEIYEKVLGKHHPHTASSLNNLAAVYREQGNYVEALRLHEQALEIREKVLGKHHPSTASSLNNLAAVYREQGKYAEALPLLKQALEIREKVLGKHHPDTATSLGSLAAVYYAQGNYAEALPLYEQALEIHEKVLGKQHPSTAISLNNLAEVYREQGNYAEVLPLLKQALEIREKVLGKHHPDTANSLNNLAAVYDAQGNYAEALPLFKQAVDIARQALGEQHPHYQIILKNYEIAQRKAQTTQKTSPEPAAVSPAPAEPPKTPEPPKTWISNTIEKIKGWFSFK